jgi:hypothetical protein
MSQDKKPRMRWKYCYNRQHLPPVYSTRVCVFKTNRGPKLESCTLIEDMFRDDRKYWIIKGDAEGKEVYPFAWLEIDTEFPDSFFSNLTVLGTIEFDAVED